MSPLEFEEMFIDLMWQWDMDAEGEDSRDYLMFRFLSEDRPTLGFLASLVDARLKKGEPQ